MRNSSGSNSQLFAGGFAACRGTRRRYQMTVNRTAGNAQNEPQNWLLMNGDYGARASSEAHPDQPRQRQEPPARLGDGAGRNAGRRAERS